MDYKLNSLKFDDLPLVEVVIRLGLAEPLPVDLTTVSILHGRVAGRFQRLEDPAETEFAPGQAVQLSIHPGTRTAQYCDHKAGFVATLQPNLVAMRWVDQGKAYPHFRELLDELVRFVEDCQVVFERPVRTNVANLAYANFVPTGATVGESLRRYLKDVSTWPTVMVDDAQFHDLNVSWRDGDIDLRVTLAYGEGWSRGERHTGCKLATVAGRRFEATEQPLPHILQLHDRLQVLFASIISDHAKHEWKWRNGR